MLEAISRLNPVIQALLATIYTWGMTALGAAGVFMAKNLSRRISDTMLGFAAGVMISASYFSLLAPSIEMASEMNIPNWLPAVVGFMAGGLFLLAVDKILPHLHAGLKEGDVEGIKTPWRRSILLVLAITLHNVPEGLAVGVAFGAAGASVSTATTASAIALAIGIGIQNFPEGLAVSAPLRREGLSRMKSFMFGQLSGLVEPFAAVIGAILVLYIQPLLPYALAFAAGAMIYVVVEELIPESQSDKHTDFATMGAMIGFAVMMLLDVAMG